MQIVSLLLFFFYELLNVIVNTLSNQGLIFGSDVWMPSLPTVGKLIMEEKSIIAVSDRPELNNIECFIEIHQICTALNGCSS